MNLKFGERRGDFILYLNLEFSCREKLIQFNFGLIVSENWLFLGRFLGNGPRVKNTTERHVVSYDVCGFDDQVFQLYFSVLKKIS